MLFFLFFLKNEAWRHELRKLNASLVAGYLCYVFDMEPVIDRLWVYWVRWLAGLLWLLQRNQKVLQAGSLLNFKGLLGSWAAGGCYFYIIYTGWSLEAFCNFVSKFCLAAAGVHMICVYLSAVKWIRKWLTLVVRKEWWKAGASTQTLKGTQRGWVGILWEWATPSASILVSFCWLLRCHFDLIGLTSAF